MPHLYKLLDMGKGVDKDEVEVENVIAVVVEVVVDNSFHRSGSQNKKKKQFKPP